jgi:hypothetical protein
MVGLGEWGDLRLSPLFWREREGTEVSMAVVLRRFRRVEELEVEPEGGRVACWRQASCRLKG